MRKILFFVAMIWASSLQAQDFSGLARVDPAASSITEARKGGVEISLALSQGIPWRLFTLDAPKRLVVDFREVDWRGVDAATLIQTDRVTDLRMGGFRPGWSRMVMDLPKPMTVTSAGMAVNDENGTAALTITLLPATEADFAAQSGTPNDPRWDLPKPSVAPREPFAIETGWEHTVVVLDPGHGGVDPGAKHNNTLEKDLMLRFAREIRDTLRRTGEFEVILTRDDDSFVSLEGRVAKAHEARADIFISLHADAILEGNAHGATVYTLSETASDAASQYLAERHDRSSVLAGIDLTGTDDTIANILLDLVRQETNPRSERLAKAMVLGMQGSVGKLNNKPYRRAGFSVLKAADIPSVLIEVGFMSSKRDLANLKNPEWRQRLADGIRDGLQAWVIADKAAKALVRQ
ncbi:N-acetylmuramoyl-L-alanine amidase [Cognatishimia sp. WU-CL00825]|uniref:N-acetylmuramoyl-L-alanine amidase n=1 Tax=Cognatishimia sp. WU-CL00825 TaxID=3127658 RepID=UPI00310B2712